MESWIKFVELKQAYLSNLITVEPLVIQYKNVLYLANSKCLDVSDVLAVRVLVVILEDHRLHKLK